MGFSLGGLVGGAIGSLFGPTGTAVGYGIGDAANSAYESNRQDSLNKQAFNRQNSAQWAFWHANNDYNSPASQMQRLEEAGLNPNLVYGNGAATHQATMATAGKSGAAGFNLNTAPLTEFYQLENMEAQNLLLLAQRAKVDAEVDAIRASIPKTQADARVAAKRARVADSYGVTSDYVSDVFGMGDKLIDYGSAILSDIGGYASDFYRGVKGLANSWEPKRVRYKGRK